MSPHEDRPLPVHPARTPGIPTREEPLEPPSDDALTRRTALKLFSATALLASGAVGCTRKPERHIVSVHERPEYQKPGVPLFYASTFTEGPYPYGMMVQAVDGRPIKIEGLPGHPLNDGTSDAFMQAATLSLYDPERLGAPRRGGETVTWEAVDAEVVEALKKASRVVLVTRSNLGPSERALIEAFEGALPGTLVRHVHEPAGDGPRRQAWKALTGKDGAFEADYAAADVILALDCDFLGTDGPTLTATGAFATRRRVRGEPGVSGLSRLYVAEGAMTVTGSNADHRMPLRPARMAALVEALGAALAGDDARLSAFAKEAHVDLAVLEALLEDLGGDGRALVVAGAHLPPSVHAAVARLNRDLGAFGTTLRWQPNAPLAPTPPATLREDFRRGCDVALFFGVNPVYDLPGFADLLANAGLVVAHGLTANETLAAATLALPSTHNLENWNDAEPTAGVRALCQPQIAPLFDGRQEAASLFAWTKALGGGGLEGAADWHAYLQARWKASLPATTSWEEALRRGFVGSPAPAPLPPLAADRVPGGADAPLGEGPDLVLLPHPTVHDGRFAGNAWLQELPQPVSKLVWDAAAAMHPETAKALGVGEGDWIRVTVEGREASLPVLLQPGTARDVIAMTLGYGRTAGAGVGDGVGTSATALLNDGAAPRFTPSVKVAKDGGRGRYALVRTQTAFSQHDRHIARAGTAGEYAADPAFAKHKVHVPPLKQLHEEWDYSQGHKWEMAIDLSLCTGCNACVVACQAENNIAIVGKDECAMNRDMHWMRIDRYESDDADNPEVAQQPMLCQHCDNAPCEMVCPVNATAHSPEGLNEQAYNRCVGTRYCGNNCPYKVRRFNYLAYSKQNVEAPIQELLYNPQVTVRSRGIMEKCTFCVQRINAGKYRADSGGRPVVDADVVTACQQACPAGAIVFGDRNDEKSAVADWQDSPLAYYVLEEINTRPSVAYLARVKNPHPRLAKAPAVGGHEAGGHG